MIKTVLKVLFVGVLITVIISAYGYSRIEEIQKPGSLAPYANKADNLNIFIVAQASDILTKYIAEISEVGSVRYVKSFNDRDIGLYLVRDWNSLDEWGLLNICEEPCTGAKHLNLKRKIELKNFAVVKKDLFLNLSDFTTVNSDGSTIKFSKVELDCLKRVLEREIRYLIPPDDPVLKCQQEFAREKHDGTITLLHSSKIRTVLGL